jgi:hypothetical protein
MNLSIASLGKNSGEPASLIGTMKLIAVDKVLLAGQKIAGIVDSYRRP